MKTFEIYSTLRSAFSSSCWTSEVDLAKDSAEEVDGVIMVRDEDDRIETLVNQIKEMFRSMSDGDTSAFAYDTAWVARIPSKDDATRPHFPTTLNWVLGNQHEDGSWGEPSLFHLYDRLVCTLACILSLKTWSIGEQHIAKAPSQYPIDLVERIWAIDTIERLGIHHYFREEISDTLDYVYRNIGKKGVPYGTGNPIPDIDDTSMALRLARSHDYEISPDILQHFKQDNGHFICHPGETHTGVSDIFNLYRFSQISYPGEKILEDAKPLLQRYLQYCIKNQVDDKWALKKGLLKEMVEQLWA